MTATYNVCVPSIVKSKKNYLRAVMRALFADFVKAMERME